MITTSPDIFYTARIMEDISGGWVRDSVVYMDKIFYYFDKLGCRFV